MLSFAGPALIPERLTVCNVASSRMVRLVSAFNVGGSLAELIVSRNEVLEDAVPSLTEMVMAVAPDRFVTGRMLTVRLLPEPLKIMFAFGTRTVFVEVPERISELAGVSTSPITNVATAVVSSLVVRFGIIEIAGLPLTAKTLLSPLDNPEALAVN